MSYKVKAQDISKIKLNETDTTASVLQNIAIILSTFQQTAVLNRGFGLPGKFIDKPIPVAKALMVAEIEEAIREFEPRAFVVGITFDLSEAPHGKLIPTVEVEITDG